MRSLSRFLIPAVCLAACGEHEPAPVVEVPRSVADTVRPDPLADYRQLIGAWMDNTTSKRFASYEEWKPQGDTALSGFGYAMAKGDTVWVEDLLIEEREGRVIYSVRIDSQNNGAWVPFTALEQTGDSLVFENPGHDFPQCITYVRDSTGAWEVAVTGNEGGAERMERFRFQRH